MGERDGVGAVSIALAQSLLSVGGMASLWCGLALSTPPIKAVTLALMSKGELAALVTREMENRESLQLAHLLIGVVHAMMMRGHQAQIWVGAWAIGITLCGEGAVLSLRIGDISLVWLPVRSACLPFLIGWLIAKLSARARAERLDDLKAELGETAALLHEEKRRSAELEEARRSSLMFSALNDRPRETGCGPEHESLLEEDARDGTDVASQSGGVSEDMLELTSSLPRRAHLLVVDERDAGSPSQGLRAPSEISLGSSTATVNPTFSC